MGFCPKCGKQLKDGEVCNCQGAKKPLINQAAVEGQVGSIVDSVKNIVLAPAQGIKNFINTASWLQVGILACLEAIFTILFSVLSMIKADLRYRSELKKFAEKTYDMKLDKYLKEYKVDGHIYKFGDYIKDAFTELLTVAAMVALGAVVIYFAAKLLKKVQITWKQAFALSAVQALVVVPVAIVSGVLSLFLGSITFFSWIISTIRGFETVTVILMFYLGFESFDADSKTSVYASCASFAVLAFANRFVSFLFDKIF